MSWLKSLYSLSRVLSPCPRSRRPVRPRPHLELEHLETRLTPSCSVLQRPPVLTFNCTAIDHRISAYAPSAALLNLWVNDVFTQWSLGGYHSVVLNAGGGNDSFDLSYLASSLSLTFDAGPGDDSVEIKGEWLVRGPVSIEGGPGDDRLHFDGRSATYSSRYEIGEGIVTRQGIYEVRHNNLEAVSVETTALDDLITVSASTPGVSLALNGGNGLDTLVGADIGNTFVVTGSDAGVLNDMISFDSFEYLRGSVGPDVFRFANHKATLTGEIDGAGGLNNKLDYSVRSDDVYVNLTTGEATGALYVGNIQDVTGGSGNDVLVGDDSSNVLDGGLSFDLLVAGGANYWGNPDTLIGGSGDDVLIAGFTAYDWDAGSLRFLRDLWAGPANYADRAAELALYLTPDTVFYNYGAGGNILTGGSGMDLFFGSLDLDAADLDVPAGEWFNPIF